MSCWSSLSISCRWGLLDTDRIHRPRSGSLILLPKFACHSLWSRFVDDVVLNRNSNEDDSIPREHEAGGTGSARDKGFRIVVKNHAAKMPTGQFGATSDPIRTEAMKATRNRKGMLA
jgi:hypothetical protein